MLLVVIEFNEAKIGNKADQSKDNGGSWSSTEFVFPTMALSVLGR